MNPYVSERETMVELQLRRRDITDKSVLSAMLQVPRENFVPEEVRPYAYADRPLPIGEDQTISQPYIVAYMCQELHLTKDSRVLEIGTGSGYETAILALCAKEVYTIEYRAALSEQAKGNLASLKLGHVQFLIGDGREGWPEQAPYDGIVLSACFRDVPPKLLTQLNMGGRLVAPLGAKSEQNLVLIEKRPDGFHSKTLMAVSFVSAAGAEP